MLADDPVDFLRLLAIGYDEICWAEEFDKPPAANGDLLVHPTVAFQDWVTSTFDVSIPRTGREIVAQPADDDDPRDPFSRWVSRVIG